MGENYSEGQEIFYKESGSIFKVRVLKNDRSNSAIEKYLLKVLEVVEINKGFSGGNFWKAGKEFRCQRSVGTGERGLWRLESRLEDLRPKIVKGTTVDEVRRRKLFPEEYTNEN